MTIDWCRKKLLQAIVDRDKAAIKNYSDLVDLWEEKQRDNDAVRERAAARVTVVKIEEDDCDGCKI